MIIKIFQVGTYPQGWWDRERVQKKVDAYEPEEGIEAPCVVGHDAFFSGTEGELAQGWVRALSLNAIDEVWADIDASEQLRQWVATRRLGYVSVEILNDDEKDENKPPRLARVAFLGRTIPQITSTRLPSLFGKREGKDEGPEHKYTRKINIKKDFKDVSTFSKRAGTSGEGQINGGNTMTEEEQARFEAVQNENLKLQEKLTVAEAKNATFEAEKAKAGVMIRVDKLVADGHLAPVAKADFARAALSVEGEG